jgi:c-di-GMP-binding flagellar brake protein YcgR
MLKARQYLRVPVQMQVQIKVLDRDPDFILTRIDDISWGGAFVVMDPQAEVGSRVVLQFVFRDASVTLELWGKVVRRSRPHEDRAVGVGVEFEPLDEDGRSLIQRMVHEEIAALVQVAAEPGRASAR